MSWSSAVLGELCDISIGRTPSRSKSAYWSGGTEPWVSISDMKQEVINETREKITELGVLESGARKVKAGTLLMSFKLSIGKLAFAGRDLYTNEAIAALTPTSQKVDTRYLWRSLERINFNGVGNRAVMGNTLNKVSLAQIEIPLPPLDEQRRIAAMLDKADALRQKRKRAIALLDSLTQSIFLEMFGDPISNQRNWPLSPLGHLLEGIEGGWSPVCLDRPAEEGEWGVLKLSAVTSGKYQPQEQKALPPTILPKPAIEVAEGDVLFTRKNTRDLVAAVALVGPTRGKLMLSDLIFRLIPGPKLLPSFVVGLLSYPTMRKSIQNLVGGAAGSMPNISKEKLRGVTAIVPPLEAQRRFAEAICTQLKVRQSLVSNTIATEALFAALQHRAFSGQL